MKLTNFLGPIWRDPVWSKVIATAIIAGVAEASFVGAGFYDVHPVLATISASAIAAIALFFGVYFWMNFGVRWDFDGCLGMSAAGSVESARVLSFQARGWNKSRNPIHSVSGHVASNVTNERFPLFLVADHLLVAPEQTNGIPGKCEFGVGAPFYSLDGFSGVLSGERGVPLDRFSRDFSSLTLVVDLDGRRSTHHISEDHIRKTIDRFVRAISPPSGPRVTRRTSPEISKENC